MKELSIEGKATRYDQAIKVAKSKIKNDKAQNTWRPSDEQLEALDFAADCIVPDEFCFKRKALKELYQDLKKLKG